MNSKDLTFYEFYNVHYKDKEIVNVPKLVDLYEMIHSRSSCVHCIEKYSKEVERYYSELLEKYPYEVFYTQEDILRMCKEYNDSLISNEEFIYRVKRRRKIEKIIKLYYEKDLAED